MGGAVSLLPFCFLILGVLKKRNQPRRGESIVIKQNYPDSSAPKGRNIAVMTKFQFKIEVDFLSGSFEQSLETKINLPSQNK